MCIMHVPAQAASQCERALLATGTTVTVTRPSPGSKTLTVKLRTHSNDTITCPQVPQNQERVVRRQIDTFQDLDERDIDRLVGFIGSPWQTLSNSAGQRLSKRITQLEEKLSMKQLHRLTHFIISNQVTPLTGQIIVRIISRLSNDVAVPALSKILQQSTRLSIQRAAARFLGRIPTEDAHTSLKSCVKNADRMLSARCERSLVRWATQSVPLRKANRKPDTDPTPSNAP